MALNTLPCGTSFFPKLLYLVYFAFLNEESNTGDTRELPAGNYVSSDEKVAVIKNNSIQAIANGDCIIHVESGGGRSEFAHVTVGWQLQNPVLPYSWKMYVPDPEVHNFGGKLYVYGSLDDSNNYCSPYYISLMTADLKRCESHGASFSSFDKDEPVPYPGKNLWDSDGHYYNGKYFLYVFFAWGPHTFVLESDNPMGPFKNFRWVTVKESKENLAGASTEIFVDDDGSRYILYQSSTAKSSAENFPVIARLTDNDVVDESSAKNLKPYVQDFFEAPSMRKRGDTYYFVYPENCGRITDKNQTPKRLSYATSKDIFGEYTYRGPIITIEQFAGDVNIQGSIEQFNGEWYVFYRILIRDSSETEVIRSKKPQFVATNIID